MPLPKPLKRSASKRSKNKRIGEVMHDLKHGPHHKERTRSQEIAIAEKYAGNERKGKRKAKRTARRPARRKSRG